MFRKLDALVDDYVEPGLLPLKEHMDDEQHQLVWKDAWYSLNQAQAHSQPSSKPHKLR